MNITIDTLVDEIETICKEYKTCEEGQLEYIYKLTSTVNRLNVVMREELEFTGFDGKVKGDAPHDRDS